MVDAADGAEVTDQPRTAASPRTEAAAFWDDLGIQQGWMNEPVLMYDDPIWKMTAKEGFLFDDAFWEVFERHPLRICHVTYSGADWSLEGGPPEMVLRFTARPAVAFEGLRGWGVTVQQDEDGSWSIHSTDLPGLLTAADTLDEAWAMWPDAVTSWAQAANDSRVECERAALASDAGSVGALDSEGVNKIDPERLADAIRAAHPNLRTFDNCGNAGKSGGCLGHDTSNEDATAIAAAYAAAGEGATFDEAGSVGGVSADTVLVGAEGPALASGTRALRLAAPFVTLVVARWDEGTGLWASTPLHAEGLKAERIIAAAYDAERQGESE